MENVEEYYKFYQKKSDPQIKDAYLELEKKSDDSTQSSDKIDIANRLTAIKKVIEERGLKIKKPVPKIKKENSSQAFDDYIKSGFKSLIIGLALFGISVGIMSYNDEYKIFLITIIIGGLMFLKGVIELSVGLYIRVSQADKFR